MQTIFFILVKTLLNVDPRVIQFVVELLGLSMSNVFLPSVDSRSNCQGIDLTLFHKRVL